MERDQQNKLSMMIEIAFFPHHDQQNSFEPYNLQTITQQYQTNEYHNVSFSSNQKFNKQFKGYYNKKRVIVPIRNPLIGLNCTTLCYIQSSIAQKIYQQGKGYLKCRTCGKQIKRFYLDMGYKQFLFKYYQQINSNQDEHLALNKQMKDVLIVQLNPKTKSYRRITIKNQFQQISQFIAKSLLKGIESYVQNNIVNLNFAHIQKLKQNIAQTLGLRIIQQEQVKNVNRNSLVYSWCKFYKKSLAQPQILLFTAESIEPKRVKINFQITYEITSKVKAKKANDLIDPKLFLEKSFYQGSRIVYIASQQIFIICLPCYNFTLYYGACLLSINDYNHKQGVLNFSILDDTAESISRKYPSVAVDQDLRTIYFFGGFNHETDQCNPCVMQISNIRWGNPYKRRSNIQQQANKQKLQPKNYKILFDLKNNVQIFKPKPSTTKVSLSILKKSNKTQSIQSINSMTSLAYQQYSDAQAKVSDLKGMINYNSQVRWLSFGGTKRQFGYYQPKVTQRNFSIRQIIYRQNNRDTGAIIQQGIGRQTPLFNCNYPLVFQIPMIGNKQIDQIYLNTLLIVDFHENIRKSQDFQNKNRLQTKCQIFKFLNIYTMTMKDIKNAPQLSYYERQLLKKIVLYQFADRSSSIIFRKDAGIFLRITIPTIEWTGKIPMEIENKQQEQKEQTHRAGYIAIQFYLQHPQKQVLRYFRVQIQ